MKEIGQCPECEQALTFFENVKSGQYVRCTHCGADLEIIDAETLEIDWAYRPLGDWDGWQELNTFLDAEWTKSRRRRDKTRDDQLDDWEDGRWYR